ncbi:histone-lysine N-methyltransferase SETD1A [Momordica charantia]|uniref:Histone-lysine N-methyltransferase SETD1A n=1 Tax=Momordica charantia TaxID=3673 RepID=A0A6J1DB83_MOMCH|nr:histone-lysine N-methyltransferase SETD1A [Momordica charantia]
MAGVASKRQREDAQIDEDMSEGEDLKRQKSYNQIMSLLEEEEEEAIEDLSSIITTLQQEIICSPDQNSQQNAHPSTTTTPTNNDSSSSSSSCSSAASPSTKEDEEERERVMRHLLEASDDELGLGLGIPNGEFLVEEQGVSSLCDALWELEDEAANYYTLFQSQLFM